MTVEKMTLANFNTVFAQMKADFALENKYKIAGKYDAIFANVSKAATTDKTFDNFKRTRVDEAIALHRIDISPADDATKQKQTGQAKIAFIQQSVRALEAAERAGDARAIVAAVRDLSTELSDAVTSYTSGMANSPDAAKDTAFLAAAGKLAGSLKGIINAETPRLAKVHVLYSTDSVKALNTISSIQAALAAAIAPPSAPADTSTDSSTNITV